MKKIKFLSFFLLIGTITFSQCITGNCKMVMEHTNTKMEVFTYNNGGMMR